MTFAGSCACQIGTAFAARTSRSSLRRIGVFTNPLLLWGIAFEIVFTAVLIYVPVFQSLFGTAVLSARDVAVLACFPVVVWGTDELRRAFVRRRAAAPARPHGPVGQVA